MNRLTFFAVALLLLGVGCIFASPAPKPPNVLTVSNFVECAAAGNPIMESYPRQCRTPDGRTFVEVIAAEPVRCTQEAKLCPDGSAVGRTGPNCAFAPCPSPPRDESPSEICIDVCGNGVCEEIVCLANGCPCAESPQTCPADCAVAPAF